MSALIFSPLTRFAPFDARNYQFTNCEPSLSVRKALETGLVAIAGVQAAPISNLHLKVVSS